jgi:dihydrodipicolinate synthase/N-acetylneuraminate lyase
MLIPPIVKSEDCMSNRTTSAPEPAHGVYVALATPRECNSVEANASALLDYIDTIVKVGVDGLVLFGSTGEFVHYDIAERIRVLSLAVKRSRVPLIVNVSHSSFDGAVDLAENAIQSEAAGILLMPPYFFRYSDDQIFAFYEQFVKVINNAIPVYLYNIPLFTNPMSAPLLGRLIATGYFAGIKDSSGEWPMFEAIENSRSKATFQNLVGRDKIYARARAAGADGIVSGVAATVPELILALDRAVTQQNSARIQLLDQRLQEFVVELQRFPATVGIKQACVVRGWKLDNAASPWDQATLTALSTYRHWFEHWLPEVLKESAAP